MGLFSSKCVSAARLDGKTAIITGSNTGIGKETAKDFFKRGARVIMACRNLEKANEAAEDIKRCCQNEINLGEIILVQVDISSLDSVRQCAQNLLDSESRIDLLINNAGIMACPYEKSKDGFELQLATNHLGHFLLTLLLLPKLAKCTPSRIVNVSSVIHEKGSIYFDDMNFEKTSYTALRAYGQSKLANVLFTKELANRINEAHIRGLTVYSLHPGVIATELGRHFDKTYFKGARWMFSVLFGFLIKTPVQGAQTTIHCAVDEQAGKETGLYYAECRVKTPGSNAQNPEVAKRLWDVSLNMVDLCENYDPFHEKSLEKNLNFDENCYINDSDSIQGSSQNVN